MLLPGRETEAEPYEADSPDTGGRDPKADFERPVAGVWKRLEEGVAVVLVASRPLSIKDLRSAVVRLIPALDDVADEMEVLEEAELPGFGGGSIFELILVFDSEEEISERCVDAAAAGVGGGILEVARGRGRAEPV